MALGCVNSRQAGRESQEAGFTQPWVHSLAHPCRQISLTLVCDFILFVMDLFNASFHEDLLCPLYSVCPMCLTNSRVDLGGVDDEGDGLTWTVCPCAAGEIHFSAVVRLFPSSSIRPFVTVEQDFFFIWSCRGCHVPCRGGLEEHGGLEAQLG